MSTHEKWMYFFLFLSILSTVALLFLYLPTVRALRFALTDARRWERIAGEYADELAGRPLRIVPGDERQLAQRFQDIAKENNRLRLEVKQARDLINEQDAMIRGQKGTLNRMVTAKTGKFRRK